MDSRRRTFYGRMGGATPDLRTLHTLRFHPGALWSTAVSSDSIETSYVRLCERLP